MQRKFICDRYIVFLPYIPWRVAVVVSMVSHKVSGPVLRRRIQQRGIRKQYDTDFYFVCCYQLTQRPYQPERKCYANLTIGLLK